jgi:hypothetical protein
VQKVPNPADERHQEQQPDQRQQREGAQHRHCGRRAARHLRFGHEIPHGILEDEGQEDPDEHDQECVADRHERREYAERHGDQQHRSHRQN